MTHEEHKLEEQVVSKAAEITVSSQLDAAEKIDIDVETNFLEAIQGNAEGVMISGEGLVMQKDVRVQEMELHTDKIDINPLSVLFGHVELNQPIDANGRIVLTEPDINRALNSNYVLGKAQNFNLDVYGQTATMAMQQMELKLPGGNKMVFTGKVLLHEMGKTRQLGFTATIHPRTRVQGVLVEGFHCHDGQTISIEFAAALMHQLKQLVHLPYIEIEQMRIRVEEMEVQAGSITMQVQAHVNQLPSS